MLVLFVAEVSNFDVKYNDHDVTPACESFTNCVIDGGKLFLCFSRNKPGKYWEALTSITLKIMSIILK